MDILENFVSALDYVLDSKRKRHIIGGIMMSMSLMFGGLAVTVFTLKEGTYE